MILVLFTQPVFADRHALLIGVSEYSDKRVPDLEGPYHDVTTLQQLLIEQWGFEPHHVTVLLNEAATEKAVLESLDALESTTKPGDEILVYFSGHGTSAYDPKLGARVHLPDGSGAIVVSDFDPDKLVPETSEQPVDDGMLVGRFELRPRFRLLNRERNVLVVFDSCFSGNTVRARQSRYIPRSKRQLPQSILPARSTSSPQATNTVGHDCDNCAAKMAEEFNYDNLVYFGAAAENQLAVDITQAELDSGRHTTFDGKPHGGFTDALLRVLSASRSHRADLSYGRLFNLLIKQFNTFCNACGHSPVSLPVIETDTNRLLDRPFLVDVNTNTKPIQLQLDAKLRLAAGPNTGVARHLSSDLQFPHGDQHTPDVAIRRELDQLVATSGDGQLLTTFPASVSMLELREWVRARQWLKQRQANDLANDAGRMLTEFKHPLFGTNVRVGDLVYFNLQTDDDAGMCLLTMNSNGDLSVLFPTSSPEAQRIFRAGSRWRIPAGHEPPIMVTLPWGTDVVLFYALPPQHPILRDLAAMAKEKSISLDDARLARFELLLDSGKVRYSANTIRFVTDE